MAYRPRKRWTGRRDVFPLRVATGAVVLLALLITLAVWAVLPAENDAGAADTTEGAADLANAELPEPPAEPAVVSEREIASPANGASATDSLRTPAAMPEPPPPVTRVTAESAPAAGAPEPPAATRVTTAPLAADDDAAAPEPPPAPDTDARAAARSAHTAGLRSFRAGDYANAARSFAQAAAALPARAEYRNDYGWALFRAGRLTEAQREIEAALRVDPRRAIAHANLAEVLLSRGDTAAGIAAYRRFLQLNTDTARERIAQDRLRRLAPAPRRTSTTAATARAPVAKDAAPERTPARTRATAPATPASDAPPLQLVTAGEEGERGAVALREGRFGAAAVHYQRAITLDPRNAEHRTGYARALFHHGALREAAAQLEEAVLWNPRHADAWALLGEVRYAQDERTRASEAYRRYLELEPDARRRAGAQARLRQITGADAGVPPGDSRAGGG